MKTAALIPFLAVVLCAIPGARHTKGPTTTDTPDHVWSPRFSYPGIGGRVEGACMYRGRLVISGGFDRVGTRSVGPVGWLTPDGWQPLPGTLSGGVLDVATAKGVLLAAGDLHAGPARDACQVAIYRGEEWEPLLSDDHLSIVDKLLADAGGVFIASGNFGPVRLYRWNGTEVTPIEPPPLKRLTDLQQHGNRLYATGLDMEDRSRVTLWDGVTWHDMPPLPMETFPRGGGAHLAWYRGSLYAALDSPISGSVPSLLRWDGEAWQDTGVRVFGYQRQERSSLHAIMVYRGNLVLGGDFQWIDNVRSMGLASWDGERWTDLAGNRNTTYWPSVRHLWSYRGGILAAGNFLGLGDIHAEGIAFWDGSGWRQMVPGGDAVAGEVRSFTIHQGDLIAGGRFTHAGDVPASNVARWTGDGWEAIGEGVPSFQPGEGQYVPGVHALTEYEGDLIAAGQMSNDAFPSDVARWNGSSWEPMGHLRAWIRSLTVYEGRLYAGGEFCIPGEGCLIAWWDGDDWVALTGLDSTVTYAGVKAMLPIESSTAPSMLVLGGWFRTQSARGVITWMTPSGGWQPLGYGFSSGGVDALCRFNGEILAAGSLNQTRDPDGTFQPVDGLVRWTGSTWRELDGSVTGWPYALAVHEGALYMGGDFTAVGDGTVGASNLARWDSGWSGIGGTNQSVFALQSAEGALFVGGRFTVAGGLLSRGIAVWGPPDWPAGSSTRVAAARPRLDIRAGSGTVRVAFSISRPQDVALNVYDVSGRLVHRLVSGAYGEGAHVLTWHGETRTGGRVPAGIYFFRLRSEEGVSIGKAIKLP